MFTATRSSNSDHEATSISGAQTVKTIQASAFLHLQAISGRQAFIGRYLHAPNHAKHGRKAEGLGYLYAPPLWKSTTVLMEKPRSEGRWTSWLSMSIAPLRCQWKQPVVSLTAKQHPRNDDLLLAKSLNSNLGRNCCQSYEVHIKPVRIISWSDTLPAVGTYKQTQAVPPNIMSPSKRCA